MSSSKLEMRKFNVTLTGFNLPGSVGFCKVKANGEFVHSTEYAGIEKVFKFSTFELSVPTKTELEFHLFVDRDVALTSIKTVVPDTTNALQTFSAIKVVEPSGKLHVELVRKIERVRRFSTSRAPEERSNPTDQQPEPLHAYILGLSSTFPEHEYTQETMAQAFIDNHKMNEADTEFVRRVFKNTMIEKSRSALPREKLFCKMGREEYMTYTRATLKDMGLRAAQRAIAEWGGNIQQITHIVWGSMTGGMHAPAMDAELIKELNLSPWVQRANVENMGCLTGFCCLSMASSLVKENPENRVLLVVGDIRSSLGNLFTEHEDFSKVDRSNVISGALFRDSCGAAVLGSGLSDDEMARALYRVASQKTYTIPGTFDLVKYTEKDKEAVHLYIDKEVPVAVGKNAAHFLDAILKATGTGLTKDDCDFCFHTGGPRVLHGLEEALDVDGSRMQASWHVMRNYGNLSGSSNLVVLDHHRMRDVVDHSTKRPWCVCMSFGPGLTMVGLALEIPVEVQHRAT